MKALTLPEWICWLSIGIIAYAYVGYGLLLWGLRQLKARFAPRPPLPDHFYPEVTLLIAAYNEADFIEAKIANSLAQDYPADKLKIVVISDGSSDETPRLAANYPEVRVMHKPERGGKLAAVHRAIPTITSPIVVFSDANTLLNSEAIYRIARHFADPKVGAVSGEKRVHMEEKDAASAAGESMYWRYESRLKQWDSDLYTVVGAAGELFAIRRELHEEIPGDTLIEDFVQTMGIAQKGYRVAYAPDAYAVETASSSVGEERKRKIRISAGAFQAIWRLRPLLNVFRYGLLSFQYISHRVLRWTLAPLGLGALLFILPLLAIQQGGIYTWLALGQILVYIMGGIGALLEKRRLRIKLLFVPYYFLMMNWSLYQGFVRYMKGQQSVTWEKAQRKVYS